MENILKKASCNHILEKDEIITLLELEGSAKEELFKKADEVRKIYKGDGVHLRGLIEFSNICKRNCLYCGIRRDNENIKRRRLSAEKIIELGKKAVETGYKTVVLQSGEDSYFDIEKLALIVREIKKTGAAVTLSIGEMEDFEYKLLKESGADRFLLRIETTDKNLYMKYHPGMSFENRLRCLKSLKKLGYETGSGVLVGLCGQTTESLARDILFFKENDFDMIGLGPLIVNDDTPLRGQKNGSLDLALKMIAVIRLIMPDINIPATTAMETLNSKGRVMALQAGANVIMPNAGDVEEKKLYNLYPGKSSVNDDVDISYKNTVLMLETIGRYPSESFGYRRG